MELANLDSSQGSRNMLEHIRIFEKIKLNRQEKDIICCLMDKNNIFKLRKYVQNLFKRWRNEYGDHFELLIKLIRDQPDYKQGNYEDNLTDEKITGLNFVDILDWVVDCNEVDILFSVFCFGLLIDRSFRDEIRACPLRDEKMLDTWCDISIKKWLIKGFLELNGTTLASATAQIRADYANLVPIFEP